MTLSSIEQQIVTEYGVVVGFIKNHATLASGLAFAIGAVVGHIF